MDRISQIDSSDDFVLLCKKLLSNEYHDFQTIDDSGGDAGNDGYSESKRILFQIYCPKKPEKTNDTTYKGKIIDDLDKAKELVDSGKYQIEEWIFITPRELRENVQTFLREESKKRGFVGIAWASPKLGGLLSKYPHIRSHFPDLILPDIEAQLTDSTTTIVGKIDDVNAVKKQYKTKIERTFQKRIDKGKNKLDKGQFESAKEDYKLIISDLELETDSIDPHIYFRAYNNLGVAELNLNNHEEASKIFKLAYEAEPDLPMAVAKLALSKMFKEEHIEALSVIDSLLEKYPDDKHAISVKANILYVQGNYTDLIPFLKSKKETALVHWYEGFQQMSAHNYEEALDCFEKVVSIEPDNIRAHMLVAQNVMVGMKEVVKNNPFPPERIPDEIKEKFIRAIECLKEAEKHLEETEQTEDIEMVHTNLSGCYVAIGSNAEAIASAITAVQVDSKSAVPYMNMGIAQLRLNKFQDAITSFQKFKDLGGEDFDADRHIAFCSLRTNDLDFVEKVVEKELETDEVLDLDISELAIDLYSRRMNKEKVDKLLERLEQEYPDNTQALRIRGLYLQRIGESGADELFQKALSTASTKSERMLAELDLADMYFKQNKYQEAGEIYKIYIDTKIGNQNTYRYIECLYNNGEYGEMLNFIATLSTKVRDKTAVSQFEAHGNLYLGNLAVAANIFKKLFAENPEHIEHLVWYGMCNFRLGKLDETKQAYDAIKNKVTETEKLLILAGGYELIGERESAIELTYKALINEPNNPKAHLGFIFTFLKREQAGDYVPKDLHVKAFQKSIGEFNKRFPEEKALQGIEVIDDDISEILDAVTKMAERADHATGLYRDSKAPLAFIPKLTGRNAFEIWAAFTNMSDVGIRISFGVPEEIGFEIDAMDKSDSIVVDIYPLFILSHLDKLDLLTQSFKKIYVHQSLVDELTESIDGRYPKSKTPFLSLSIIPHHGTFLQTPPEAS